MKNKVNCILLIDDNPGDNFYHERVIRKHNAAKEVICVESGNEALEYLMAKKEHPSLHPDIIFLDINMPGMNGWNFLEHYKKLDKGLQSKVIVVMLTTSENPEDKAQSLSENVITEFKTKPLTKEILDEVLVKHSLATNAII